MVWDSLAPLSVPYYILMDKRIFIPEIIVIICVLFLLWVVWKQNEEMNNLRKNFATEFDEATNSWQLNKCKIWNGKMEIKDVAEGFYSHDGYICFWIKDRSFPEWQETLFHEIAHHYVSEDYNHFCGITSKKRR